MSLIFIIPIIKLEGTEKEHENRKPDNNSTWKATFSFIRLRLLPILVFSMALNSILIILDILGAPLILYSIGGGPELYGLFMGSFSLGGLIGAILIPRIRIQRIWILIIGYFTVTGASLFAMGVQKNAPIVEDLRRKVKVFLRDMEFESVSYHIIAKSFSRKIEDDNISLLDLSDLEGMLANHGKS